MNLRERISEPMPPPPADPFVPDAGGLDALAQQGDALLAAGAGIIAAALSGNSQAFLEANRQSGGQ